MDLQGDKKAQWNSKGSRNRKIALPSLGMSFMINQ